MCTHNITTAYICHHLFSDWSDETHDVTVTDFVQPVRPAVIVPTTVVGIFRLFFTSALVGTIVHETNAYARQVLGLQPVESGKMLTPTISGHFWGSLC